jgi:hypothetical protein
MFATRTAKLLTRLFVFVFDALLTRPFVFVFDALLTRLFVFDALLTRPFALATAFASLTIFFMTFVLNVLLIRLLKLVFLLLLIDKASILFLYDALIGPQLALIYYM